MKKFVSILLAVVLIFSVLTCVGCEADKKEENTITYYHYEPQVSPVSSLIYQYNEKCKNVQNRINIVEFDNIEKMTSQLTTELMAGKARINDYSYPFPALPVSIYLLIYPYFSFVSKLYQRFYVKIP